MSNKIVKYTLNSDGTVPGYIFDGGYAPKENGGVAPQNLDFIGATIYHASASDNEANELGKGELVSEAAVKSYLDTYTSGWKTLNVTTGVETDFDQVGFATYIWSKKQS